jgi:uncharacterized DUF497 family protein
MASGSLSLCINIWTNTHTRTKFRWVTFEWDEEKELANIDKHGVDFAEAQQAFLDSSRLVFEDRSHSADEPRLLCIGKTMRGILSVRYTRRYDRLRIIGAGYGRKGKKIYEKENAKIHRR